MNRKKKFVTILLLGLLTAIVPFTIDMYLPGFPDIASSLNATVSKVALSLSSFFIGMGLGQLVYGPLLDRFGRKKPLYAGLFLYCVTSLGCAYATSIEMLIVLRFIQAMGACSATISATAMVRDLFPPYENAKIFSFLILVLSASPMLAPSIGSWVSLNFGWRSIFLVLTFLIILIFLGVLFFLPESKGADKKYSLRLSSILKNYKAVFGEPYFVIYALIGGIGFAGLFAHIASSPGVFMEHYALTQKEYGWLFTFLASGLILASQVNTALLKRFKSEELIGMALIFQIIFSAVLLIISVAGIDNFWITSVLLFIYLSSIGLVMPNASALSMNPFERNAGSASALLGFIQMGLGSLATVFVGVLNIKTVFPLSVCITICSVIAFGLVTWSKYFFRNQLSKNLGRSL